MSKKATVYVIEYQNSVGAWEINGPAFIDEKAASRYVSMLTVKEVAGYMIREEFAEALELDLEKDSKLLAGKDDETFYAIVDLLEKRGKEGLIDSAAEELQCGGFYSWEQVILVGRVE